MSKETSPITVNILTDTKTSAGICAFEILYSGSLLNILLKVEIPGSGYAGAVFDFISERKIIGIHTHLLEPGIHTILFTIISNDQVLNKNEATIIIDVGTGLHEIVRNSLLANETPLVFEGPCDSSFYPYNDTSVQAWFDKPDAEIHIRNLLLSEKISNEESQYLCDFIKNGFIVIEDMIDDDLVDNVNIEIDDAIEKGYQGYKQWSSQRLEHLHKHYPNMRKLWLDNSHRRIVDLIFGVQSRPTQTLTFVCGSQQPPHADLIYLTSFPAGYMCGTWIALQDVVKDSGELVVYPGSHRECRVYLQDTGCEKANGDSQALNEYISSLG
jgi:hypothetical protein